MENQKENRRMVDLFCGCRGMSLGFQRAGFKVVGAFEYWDAAAKCYEANFSHPVYRDDLTDVANAIEKIRALSPDIITGGPPCQDFSNAGKRVEGKRAGLTTAYANIIASVRPKYFIMENVPQAQKSKNYAEARKIFKSAGYGLTEVVLTASFYGVPQRRKRFFCIGSLNASDGFLSDYISKSTGETETTMHSYFGNTLGFEHYYVQPLNYGLRAVFSIDAPCPTIMGVNVPRVAPCYKGHKNDSIPYTTPGLRPLTTLERAQVQTFPDDFIWTAGTTATDRMIGNAVPVLLAEFVARALAHHIALNGSHATEVRICDSAYQVGIDENGREYARTYNAKHKMWVRLSFAQIANEEAVKSALDVLKRDYIQKIMSAS